MGIGTKIKTMIKTYAERAIAALMNGETITIDGYKYIYLRANKPVVIEEFEFESPVSELSMKARQWKEGDKEESSPILLGSEHITLSYFLAYCESKTLEDSLQDFPVTLPVKKRDTPNPTATNQRKLQTHPTN